MNLIRRSVVLSYVAVAALLLSSFAFASGAQTRAAREDSAATRLDALNAYAQDLTKAARTSEASSDDSSATVARVLRVLSRREGRSNPLLVTDNAANGRAVVETVARRVVAGEAPDSLRGAKIYALDAGRLLAGSKSGAEFGQKFAAVLRDVKRADGRIVLFVENLDGLLSSKEEQAASAALDALAAEIERGTVKMIGAVTPAAFELKMPRTGALKSRVQEIFIDKDESAQADDEGDAGETSDAESNGAGFTGERISPDLRDALNGGGSSQRISVILQGEDLKNTALLNFLKESGARVGGNFAGLGAQFVEMPLSAVRRLSELRGVSYVSLDGETKSLDGHLSTTTGKDEIETEQIVTRSGVVEVRSVDGKGVGIAILDSGIYAAHKSFLDRTGKSRVVFSRDFTGEGRTDDPYGHGTHVAGIAAGNGQIANGAYEGVAPDANIINLRVLNSQGTGTVSGLLAALDWLLANRTLYNIRVANLSLGTAAINSYRNDPVCRAVRRLVDAGVVVAVAAGNDGKDASGRKIYGAIHAPGDEPSAITVGASNTFGTNTRSDDVVATYSSRGPTRGFWTDLLGVRHYDNLVKPDVVAPGNKLISAESESNLLVGKNPSLDRNVSASPDSEMMTLSGTSVSTPVVAGTAALMLQVNPLLTPNLVKVLLMYTAQQLRGFNAFEQGAGQLNIAGAVTLAERAQLKKNGKTHAGTPLFDTSPQPYTTIAGHTFTWSLGIIVGKSFATGPGLVLYQKTYDLGVLLSDGITISEGVLLSDRSIWTTGVTISESILTSNGTMMSDGTPFCSAGVLLGDGVLLSDGVLLGDGVLLSDGVIMGDGVLLSDSTRAMLALVKGDPTASMATVKDNGTLNLNY